MEPQAVHRCALPGAFYKTYGAGCIWVASQYRRLLAHICCLFCGIVALFSITLLLFGKRFVPTLRKLHNIVVYINYQPEGPICR